jgi:hypothetical protein
MTHYAIFCVQQNADFLITALHLALKKLNCSTWRQCCEETVVQQNMYGKKLAIHARIVINWHYVFAPGGSSFANPNPTAASGTKPLPFFFENNSAARDLFRTYADPNLNLLSSNLMTEYVNLTLIPILYKEQNKDPSEEEQLLLKNYLRSNGFLEKNKTARTNIAQGKVLNWMNAL